MLVYQRVPKLIELDRNDVGTLMIDPASLKLRVLSFSEHGQQSENGATQWYPFSFSIMCSPFQKRPV